VNYLAAFVAAVEDMGTVATDGGAGGAGHAAIVGRRRAGGKPLPLSPSRVVKQHAPSGVSAGRQQPSISPIPGSNSHFTPLKIAADGTSKSAFSTSFWGARHHPEVVPP
jgi:hypothetical protein